MGKRKHFIFLSITLLLFSISLVGCQSVEKQSELTTLNPIPQAIDNRSTNVEQPQPKRLKVGVTFLGYQEAFPATIRKLMIVEAKKREIELTVYNGRESTELQIGHIEEMIRNKVDVIILNPVDANGAVKGVDLAVKAGIPIIGVNAIVNSDQLLTYIGSNDIEAGETEMQFIADKINGKGNIVVLNGITGQSSQVQRSRGIINVLNRYPNIQVLEQASANWSSTEGYQLIKQWFAKHPGQIDAIVSQNDEMALGAVKYMKEANLPHIPIIGVDGLPEALMAVESGDLDATVFQDAAGQAKMAIDVAQRIVNGGHLAKTYFIPFQIVTKENVSVYTKKENLTSP
jgi:inositol transport system substrate-binding protein